MRWLSVAYSLTAAAWLTLAAVNLLVWFKQPARCAHLAFSVTAIFVAAITPFEFGMARAENTRAILSGTWLVSRSCGIHYRIDSLVSVSLFRRWQPFARIW